jgi:hypothetical protein
MYFSEFSISVDYPDLDYTPAPSRPEQLIRETEIKPAPLRPDQPTVVRPPPSRPSIPDRNLKPGTTAITHQPTPSINAFDDAAVAKQQEYVAPAAAQHEQEVAAHPEEHQPPVLNTFAEEVPKAEDVVSEEKEPEIVSLPPVIVPAVDRSTKPSLDEAHQQYIATGNGAETTSIANEVRNYLFRAFH